MSHNDNTIMRSGPLPMKSRTTDALPAACALLLVLIAVSLGCNKESKRVVGVVPKGANHIFWKTVQAGAVKAAREYGLEVEWNAPTLEIDASRQISIVESMINRRLAGIVLAPVDRKALVAVVERAAAAGIPVAVFDSGIDTDRRISYVATDNREGGRLAARTLAELVGGQGKVAVVGFMAGSASTMDREGGFEEEIRSRYPDIAMVQMAFGMASQAVSMRATENILNAHPDLKGIFADNESSSAGAVQALKARPNRKLRMVAFDSSDQLVADLRAGHIDALILQDPFKMGYEATKAVGPKLSGKEPEREVDSGIKLVRRDELEQADVLRLIKPNLQPYLGE